MNIVKKKTILVTGGCGYIGSNMTRILLDEGYEVVVIDDLSNSEENLVNFRAKFYQGNIDDAAFLKDIFAKYDFFAVFHFAAFIEAGESMVDPSKYYRNNVANSLIFIDEIIKKYPNIYFIFSSTAAVYEQKNDKIKEFDLKAPSNIYGKTKFFVEEILLEYKKNFGLKCGILRYFNASGADSKNFLGENRKTETHLIPRLMRYINRGDIDFKIFGDKYKTRDGTCVRDYVHVLDICSAHLKLLNFLVLGGVENIFNIGTGNGYSVFEIITKAKEITNIDFNVKIAESRLGDPDSLVACSELIKKRTNWIPVNSDLGEILLSAWKWEKYISNKS